MASRPMPFEAALMGMLVSLARVLLELKKQRGPDGGDGGLAL
jgi:hypothetical protein